MSRDRANGFTLVEVLVALLLTATVVANVATLCVIATRAAQSARTRTSASLLAVQKMEQLQALTWTTSGAPPGTLASDLASDLATDPPGSGGPGLGPSPADTLDRDTAGYVDYLDAGGVWVGSGPAPPPRAVYVRRWRIDPLPSDPINALVLQVYVTTVAAARAHPAGLHARDPDDELLVDVKTRTVR